MLSFNVAVRYGGTLFASVCNYMGGVQKEYVGQQDALIMPTKDDKKCPVCVCQNIYDEWGGHYPNPYN